MSEVLKIPPVLAKLFGAVVACSSFTSARSLWDHATTTLPNTPHGHSWLNLGNTGMCSHGDECEKNGYISEFTHRQMAFF